MNYLTRIKGIFGRIFLQGLLTSLCSLCSLYSAVALAGPVSSAFEIDVDTTTQLLGRFNTALAVDPCANPSFGNACAEVDVNFFPMPNGEFDPCMDCLYIIRNVVIPETFQIVTVGSGNEGNPDDPNVPVVLISSSPDNDLRCLDGTEFGCSGTYTNTDEGLDVNWRFYGFTLNEDNFSFTGEFNFQVVPAPATLGLIAFGLLAIRLRCSRLA